VLERACIRVRRQMRQHPGDLGLGARPQNGRSLSRQIYELPWREEWRRESPDEREMRRKAADRKSGVPVPRFQPVGRLPEGGDEFKVEPVELLACFFAVSVETRGWRLLRPVWLCPRILPTDRIRSERLLATPLPLSAGRVLNPLDHALDLMAVLLGGEMLPAGQGHQDECLGLLESCGLCISPRCFARYSSVRLIQTPPGLCRRGGLARHGRRATRSRGERGFP
jgi:hypothetical protein